MSDEYPEDGCICPDEMSRERHAELAAMNDRKPSRKHCVVREPDADEQLAAKDAEIRSLRQKLAVAGAEGSPPPGEDTTIGMLQKRAITAESALSAARETLDGAKATLSDVVRWFDGRGKEHVPDSIVTFARARLAQISALLAAQPETDDPFGPESVRKHKNAQTAREFLAQPEAPKLSPVMMERAHVLAAVTTPAPPDADDFDPDHGLDAQPEAPSAAEKTCWRCGGCGANRFRTNACPECRGSGVLRPTPPPSPASDMQLRVREMLKRAEKSVREARELGRGLFSGSDSDLRIGSYAPAPPSPAPDTVAVPKELLKSALESLISGYPPVHDSAAHDARELNECPGCEHNRVVRELEALL
jgi:hypothetical protein